MTLCAAVIVPLFVLFSLLGYWPMAVVLAVCVLPLCLLHERKTLKAMHEDGDTYKGIRALAHPVVPFILLMPVWLLMFD
ncbi:MAG: hypothetical protein ACXIUM_03165 [Wenzhouxiangella sp.]